MTSLPRPSRYVTLEIGRTCKWADRTIVSPAASDSSECGNVLASFSVAGSVLGASFTTTLPTNRQSRRRFGWGGYGAAALWLRGGLPVRATPGQRARQEGGKASQHQGYSSMTHCRMIGGDSAKRFVEVTMTVCAGFAAEPRSAAVPEAASLRGRRPDAGLNLRHPRDGFPTGSEAASPSARTPGRAQSQRPSASE